MARVLGLVADLLFGSRIQSALEAGGHEVELIADAPRLSEQLANARTPAGAVLLIDLTDAQLDGARVLEELAREGALGGMRTLGFYSHVDVRARERAELAGFDLLVPRSRMAREASELVARVSLAP
jgi:DNA-binding NarL/FixJ family response regulator